MNHAFQRLTTLYKAKSNELQTKSLLIRLLEISQNGEKRVAKVLSELNFDISQLIGKVNHKAEFQFKSTLAPDDCFIKTTISVAEI